MAKKPKIQPRKPPKATTAAEKFIGGAESGAPAGVGVRGGATTRRLVKTGTYRGQLEARVTVTIPEDLLMKARLWCVENRSSLSAIMIEAIRSRVGA